MKQEDGIEEKLSHKILNWKNKNENIGNDEDVENDMDLLLKILIGKQLSEGDLGGLKALRGFVYQYFIAIYYMIEMNYSSAWDLITFELLDDIALINSQHKKIRYIQVKTKREDGKERTLTVSNDLVKRTDGLNCWIDKLFKSHDSADKLYSDFSIEYELATNEKVKTSLDDYRLNDSFEIKNIDSDDELFKAMKNGKNKKKKNKKGDIIQESEIWSESELIDNLKKFRVKNFERTEILVSNIATKLASHKAANEKEEGYCKAAAEYIVKELLYNIAIRTCDDSKKTDHGKLIFTKKEVSEWIEYGWKIGFRENNSVDNQINIRAHFKELFKSVRSNINNEWKNDSAEQLIVFLDKLEIAFINQDKEDPYFYNKYVARLFNFKNDQYFKFEKESNESNGIKLSIFYLLILHVFQKGNDMILDESNFIFKNGINIEDVIQNFAICDVKGKKSMHESKCEIILSAENCLASKRLKHDYYCIISDVLKNTDEIDDLFDMTLSTPSFNTKIDEIPSLVDRFKNIKFIDGDDKIKPFIEIFKRKDMENDLTVTNKVYAEAFRILTVPGTDIRTFRHFNFSKNCDLK